MMRRGLIYTLGDNACFLCSSFSLFLKLSWSLRVSYFHSPLAPMKLNWGKLGRYLLSSRRAPIVTAGSGVGGDCRPVCTCFSVRSVWGRTRPGAAPQTPHSLHPGHTGEWPREPKDTNIRTLGFCLHSGERGLLSLGSLPIRTIGGIIWATHGECFFVNKMNPEQSRPEK